MESIIKSEIVYTENGEIFPYEDDVREKLNEFISGFNPGAEINETKREVDSFGLRELEFEVKEPNSEGYVVFSYQRQRESDKNGRNGSKETAIHYYMLDKDGEADYYSAGASIAKFIKGEWVKTDDPFWRTNQ